MPQRPPAPQEAVPLSLTLLRLSLHPHGQNPRHEGALPLPSDGQVYSHQATPMAVSLLWGRNLGGCVSFTGQDLKGDPLAAARPWAQEEMAPGGQ